MNFDVAETIRQATIVAVPLIVAVSFHELSHGWMAERFGDRTARNLGRITLNPIAHVDPVGTVILPLMLLLTNAPFLFGWAKPVPINPLKFRPYRKGLLWTALAGPGSNLILATLSALLHIVVLEVAIHMPEASVAQKILEPLAYMLQFSIRINVVLMMFNMLPILPLDGGRVFYVMLPDNLASQYEKTQSYGFIIMLALILVIPPTSDAFYFMVSKVTEVFYMLAFANVLIS